MNEMLLDYLVQRADVVLGAMDLMFGIGLVIALFVPMGISMVAYGEEPVVNPAVRPDGSRDAYVAARNAEKMVDWEERFGKWLKRRRTLFVIGVTMIVAASVVKVVLPTSEEMAKIVYGERK